MFVEQLASFHDFNDSLHWGKVLTVEGSECMIKWQTEKKPISHSIVDVFLTAFHSIPISDSASEAFLYLEFDHEATDPKTQGAQLLRRIPRRRVIQPGFFCSFTLQYNCNTTCHPRACTAVCDSHSDQVLRTLHPNKFVPALYAHFLRLLQSAHSVPSSRFLAQTLFRGIIQCTKTSGFAS